MIVVDDELEALKRSTDEEMRQLQESIKTNQAQLANLEREMPQPPAVSKTAVFKKAILFGIIGGVLGGVIICLWVLLAYLRTTVWTERIRQPSCTIWSCLP